MWGTRTYFPWRGGEGGGGGEGGYSINFCWVCAAGFSELVLPHYSLCCGHIIDSILVTL